LLIYSVDEIEKTIRMASISKASAAAPEDNRWRLLESTMKRYQYRSDALIEVLHKAQELFGYLSPAVLSAVAKALEAPPSKVYGVATFYHFFSLAPKGHHNCTVCLGTACYVKGAAQLLTALEQHLAIHAGQTTADGEISLSTARCLGACGIAPVAVVDDAIAGHQTADIIIHRLEQQLIEEPLKS
jgi:bidirectional [NiFe] hydrogenase diaphorase subunit